MAPLITEFSKTKRYNFIMAMWIVGLVLMLASVLVVNEHTFLKIVNYAVLPYYTILLTWFIIEFFKFRKKYKS